VYLPALFPHPGRVGKYTRCGGAAAGWPMWSRMRSMVGGSSTKAMIRMGPPQFDAFYSMRAAARAAQYQIDSANSRAVYSA